tara:strand:+ start:576 stop:833 length:258 start_codon:yes stop_codon:yes gene_type:complete
MIRAFELTSHNRFHPQSSPVRRVIDLKGPQGNAFYLLGIANSTSKQLGQTKEQREEIINDMRDGNYEHLLEVFARNFETIYILER